MCTSRVRRRIKCFHFGVLQCTSTKCTKKDVLFGSLNQSFFDVTVVVVVVVAVVD